MKRMKGRIFKNIFALALDVTKALLATKLMVIKKTFLNW